MIFVTLIAFFLILKERNGIALIKIDWMFLNKRIEENGR